MMKIFVAVVLLISGVAATDNCDVPRAQVCILDDPPDAFPETEEEFKNVCNFALGFLECGVKYEEKCNPDGIVKEKMNDFLSSFKEICDEDTLLYAAIVENLKCFTAIEEGGILEECGRESMSPSTVEYAESLAENGLLALPDDETELHNERACIGELIAMACVATKIGKKCGEVAMDTFVEVLQKFSTTLECPEKIHLLPEVIQIYKLREEEANEISNILKKRK